MYYTKIKTIKPIEFCEIYIILFSPITTVCIEVKNERRSNVSVKHLFVLRIVAY